jgi:hypothetical protein
MTDDLVGRLRLQADTSLMRLPDDHVYVSHGGAADRIEFLEAALIKIHMLAEARSRHAWDDHATYYRISTAALDGKTDD